MAIRSASARLSVAAGTWQPPPVVVDWAPMIYAIAGDLESRRPAGLIAARFQNTLVQMIVAVASRAGETRVVLTGGCFQNRWLTERAVLALRAAGFRPYWHQRVPPNDGGIALGQVAAYRRRPAGRRRGSDAGCRGRSRRRSLIGRKVMCLAVPGRLRRSRATIRCCAPAAWTSPASSSASISPTCPTRCRRLRPGARGLRPLDRRRGGGATGLRVPARDGRASRDRVNG